MGHYDTCRPENCAICGQALGHCEHTRFSKPPIVSMTAILARKIPELEQEKRVSQHVIEEIRAYKAGDLIFADKKEAETHAAKLQLTELMDNDGVCRGVAWDDGMIRDWILSRAADIHYTLGKMLAK